MEIKKFTHDEKELTIKQLAELVHNIKFHGMDAEFYIHDLQEPTQLVNVLQEDAEFTPIR